MLTTLPKDLTLYIVNEWLCSLKDFIALDKALINREIRIDFFQQFVTRKNKISGTHQIPTKFLRLSAWKEKRGLFIEKISVYKSLKVGILDYDLLTTKFSSLRELEIMVNL